MLCVLAPGATRQHGIAHSPPAATDRALSARTPLFWGVPPPPERTHYVLPVPIFSYEPGVGFGSGVLGRYVYRRRDERLSRVQLDLIAFFSVTGVQSYVFRTRMRDLLGFDEVIDINFEALIDPVFSYAGMANAERIGNAVLLSDAYEAKRFSIGPDVNYQFRLLAVDAERLPSRARGLFRGFVGYRFEFDRFDAEPTSFLAVDRPDALGVERRGLYYAGLAWDSRDNDYAPRSGGFHDVSVASAGEWAGATRRYTRVNLSLRQYQRLGHDRVVLAASFLGDALFGDVPLVPKGEFSGLVYREAIGGLYTGRGYVRRRFQGDTKIYGTTELRFELFDMPVLRWALTPGLKAFVDGGWVWDPDGDRHGAGAISGGAGMFFIWDHFEVLRVEYGFSPEGASLVLAAQQAF
jgi:hypothetical protein